MSMLGWVLVATMIPSLAVAWLATFVVRRCASRLGLLDRPGHRKVHQVPTPLGGGLAIWLGVVVTFAIGSAVVYSLNDPSTFPGWMPASAVENWSGLKLRMGELWGILAAGSVLMGLGLLDDRRGLPWQWRLGVEFLVAAASVWWLDLRLTAFLPFPLLTLALTVVWIVMLVNSFNMLDNMDGLSGGVAAISSTMLAIAMWLLPDPSSGRPQLFVAAMLLVLVGGLLGFLWHNRPPAKIFMGDCGSYFIGYWIAIATLLATYAGYRSGQRHAILVPVCALAVPLYDLSTVIVLRLREGRSPFQADKRHFSHRLTDLGLSKVQAVLTIYVVTTTCGLAALVLTQVGTLGAVLTVGIVLCMMGIVAILESTGWKKGAL
jgi:UDP-GlcNAc:undecaprenyl-phosphate/decaprenyl-phosphate GlcNAc-1-phosphate transferase